MIVYNWLSAHALQIALTIGAINTLLRMVPAATWAKIETDWPRLAHLARSLRAIGPDVIKWAKALWGIWTGLPWPSALAMPERASVAPPPLPIQPKDGAK